MTAPSPSDGFRHRFELRNRRDEIDATERALLQAIEDRGYDDATRFAIRLALEEALSNAFKHGNKNNPELPVHIDCRIGESRIEIEVEDQGEGFEPESIPDPTQQENLEIPSGRGIVLMRSFMAEVTFEPPGNRVRMVYRRG